MTLILKDWEEIKFGITDDRLVNYCKCDYYILDYFHDWDMTPKQIIEKRYKILNIYINIFERFNNKIEQLYSGIYIKPYPNIIINFIEDFMNMEDYPDLDELFEMPIEENIYKYIINPIPANLHNCSSVDYTYNHKLCDASLFAQILYKIEQNIVYKLGITNLDKNRFDNIN
jgi:hypothetical protein